MHACAKQISTELCTKVRYAFCTLVRNKNTYNDMLTSFLRGGFDGDDVSYLYIDNSEGNHIDAYAGYNLFLQRAHAEYIVLCHEDVSILEDGRCELDESLADLNRLDPTWGACGNAGVSHLGVPSYSISDPHGRNRRSGVFPCRVMSLDENFIVVRKAANLALSRDLHGFHWHGSDLCLISNLLGWSTYVIDFHLEHRSRGIPDMNYVRLAKDFKNKYGKAFRSRWQYAPTGAVFLSNSRLISNVARIVRRIRKVLSKQTV